MATTLREAFETFKSRLELSDSFQDAITTHHNSIRSWVESCDPNIETKLIGSLQKQTKIQPLEGGGFDIDILVVLGSFYAWTDDGITPKDALDDLESDVQGHDTYKKMGPETDSPTIVFEYKDGTKVELVPAYRDFIGDKLPKGRGYYIPYRNRWVPADYDFDAEYITNMNKNCEGWLIPTIKMLKAAKRNLFSIMKSYHLEILASSLIPIAIAALKDADLSISYPKLVYRFFLGAPKKITESAIIPGSKSAAADEYLSHDEKKNLADYFKKLSDYCSANDFLVESEAIDSWRKIFDKPFPAGG